MATKHTKLRAAVEWYERMHRSMGYIGVNVDLAYEAADRFGAPRAALLQAIGYREGRDG